MAKQVWQSKDGMIHNTEEQAVTQDTVCDITGMVHKAYQEHGGVDGDFPLVSEHDIKNVMDILINTDVLASINQYLGDRRRV